MKKISIVALPGLPISVPEDLADEAFVELDERDKVETTKGGAGSGNFGHAGRPGKVGGSAPDGHGTPGKGTIRLRRRPMGVGDEDIAQPEQLYDHAALDGMDMNARRDAWKNLSVQEQDRQANAAESIPYAQRELLKGAGKRPPMSGNIDTDIQSRMTQIGDMIAPDSAETIANTATEMAAVLKRAGVSDEDIYALSMEAVDALAAQEYESMTRVLGDHGIHHIRGNIETAVKILNAVPGNDTPEAIASAYVACVFHDTGYLTEPSRQFLDNRHAQWSAEHYAQNVRPLVEQALGTRAAEQVGHYINDHAGTSIDWEGDPVGSSIRLSDNLALFHYEKLPPVFRTEENLEVLGQLHEGVISVGQAKQALASNVERMDVSPRVKTALLKAVSELTPVTPKYTLGMLGGSMGDISWNNGRLVVQMRVNPIKTKWQKVLDLGQRQLAKFVEPYGVQWTQFRRGLRAELRSPKTGEVVIETQAIETKEVKQTLKTILNTLLRNM